ncbi:uncharacterized protein LOC134748611 [Cydia strobilella]|uniref:uncharacterized protein LOC134748611 n=1 Tax=Cydia strobilella TaxID=1100964 RepID=UPI0030065F11
MDVNGTASTSITENRKRKKSFMVRSQARNMAKHILLKCEEEKRLNKYTFTVNQALDRAAYYTGLSKRVLSNIKKEPVDAQGCLKSPSKKGRNYTRKNILNVDNFDRQVLHRCIEEFYLSKKTVPTCKKLLSALREKINFPWGVTSLRGLLKRMGYKWQKCQSRRRILIERTKVLHARSVYLSKILQFRESDRQIFFLDETWIDNNLTFKKCWRDDNINANITDKSSSNQLILVHAGSSSGFLNGAKLLFEAGPATGDYHGQMGVNFEKWAKEMLLPNLPTNSVVVMDNMPYHSLQDNKPSKSSTKQAKIDWLARNNVQADLSMRKDYLCDLVDLHKSPENTFKMDELLKRHGHDVLQLPPYMCDLNPIQLALAKVKRLVREQNVTSDFSLARLKEVTEQAIMQVTQADWRRYDDHVLVLEELYWQRDGVMEDVIDSFVIEVRDESSTSNSSSSDFSESDSA